MHRTDESMKCCCTIKLIFLKTLTSYYIFTNYLPIYEWKSILTIKLFFITSQLYWPSFVWIESIQKWGICIKFVVKFGAASIIYLDLIQLYFKSQSFFFKNSFIDLKKYSTSFMIFGIANQKIQNVWWRCVGGLIDIFHIFIKLRWIFISNIKNRI
jgi:hypothetical protein